jgi:hypothetical protein
MEFAFEIAHIVFIILTTALELAYLPFRIFDPS